MKFLLGKSCGDASQWLYTHASCTNEVLLGFSSIVFCRKKGEIFSTRYMRAIVDTTSGPDLWCQRLFAMVSTG